MHAVITYFGLLDFVVVLQTLADLQVLFDLVRQGEPHSAVIALVLLEVVRHVESTLVVQDAVSAAETLLAEVAHGAVAQPVLVKVLQGQEGVG